jgi:hypothetical protein
MFEGYSKVINRLFLNVAQDIEYLRKAAVATWFQLSVSFHNNFSIQPYNQQSTIRAIWKDDGLG